MGESAPQAAKGGKPKTTASGSSVSTAFDYDHHIKFVIIVTVTVHCCQLKKEPLHAQDLGIAVFEGQSQRGMLPARGLP
jgi:hypothetical protein